MLLSSKQYNTLRYIYYVYINTLESQNYKTESKNTHNLYKQQIHLISFHSISNKNKTSLQTHKQTNKQINQSIILLPFPSVKHL